MFAVKLRPDIVFRVVLIGVVLFYVLSPNAVSSSSQKGQVDMATDSDATLDNISPENSQFTEKELRVISLLLEGKSNSQIAFRLGVCTRTVEYHLTRIYERLGISSRVEAIIKLIRLFQK